MNESHPRLPDAWILGRTAEHLQLVGVSLTLAVAVAVPLGVLAFRRPRLGQAELAVVGVIQTIPSLALLVFMIPLLGIGAIPATVALFLYSLAPNRAQHPRGPGEHPRRRARVGGSAGAAADGHPAARGAAQAARPGRHQERGGDQRGDCHPRGALGAGGLGQPILTGIRLDDVGLVIEGAVPAAVLALLVQGLFNLAERALVPRGLRLTA